MTIKNLTLSGGGPNGIIMLGIIQKLEERNYFNMNNIEKIYATSVGAIISLLLSMKFEWKTINDYIIQRPWHETYHISLDDIIACYSKKGLFDRMSIETFYKPFFNAKDLNISMTMKEFYEYSNIELHFFSQEINTYNTINISYKTFPDIPVIDAVLMSCSVPILFTPVIVNNNCYIDGCFEANYPMSFCLEENKNVDEILGIYNSCENKVKNINDASSLFDFIIQLFYKVVSNNILKTINIGLLKNEIIFKTEPLTLSFFMKILYSSENRRMLLEKGIQIADNYLDGCINELS